MKVIPNMSRQIEVGVKQDEVKMTGDLIELREPDINGNMYIMTMTTQHGIKAGRGSKTKKAKELYKVTTELIQDVQALYPHGITAVMSFHTDMEQGIVNGVKQELQANHIKVTNTEGHDSKGNSKAERTNRG